MDLFVPLCHCGAPGSDLAGHGKTLKVPFLRGYFCYNRIMEKDVLSQVIEAEKEIQQCLDLEKIKAREWLERVKKDCEEEFIREEKNIKESLERAVAEAAREADARAAGAVSRATAEAERLGRVEEETLSRIVAQQVAVILPG